MTVYIFANKTMECNNVQNCCTPYNIDYGSRCNFTKFPVYTLVYANLRNLSVLARTAHSVSKPAK